MKKENESNGFLGFMRFVYFAFIGILFIGTFVIINELPKDSGEFLIIIFMVLIQILILVNLIILNERNIVGTVDIEEENLNIRDGLFEQFYDNGNIKIRGSHVNGKKDGVWESFYYDGSSYGTQTFKNGKQLS